MSIQGLLWALTKSAKLLTVTPYRMAKFYALIAVVSLCDLVAEYFGKTWVLGGKSIHLALTGLTFGVAGLFFAWSLKFEGLAIANIIWTATTAILVTLMGYFVFKEHLSVINIVGILVILFGITLVNVK